MQATLVISLVLSVSAAPVKNFIGDSPRIYINDYQTCASSDYCSGGFTCCVAPLDINTGKTTCRPVNDCSAPSSPNTPVPWNNPGNQPSVQPGSNNGVGVKVPDWQTCYAGNFCASSGFTCCVAPGDVQSQKSTCRPFNDCSGSNGTPVNNNSGGQWNNNNGGNGAGQWNNPQSGSGSQKPSGGNIIADYQTCYAGSSCTSSGFTCCVGPKDAWENKTTCRPSNDCTSSTGGWSNNNNGGQWNNNKNNGGQWNNGGNTDAGSCWNFGERSCGKDQITMYQCGYVQGGVLKWRQTSQCGQGTRCVVDYKTGYAGCV